MTEYSKIWVKNYGLKYYKKVFEKLNIKNSWQFFILSKKFSE